MEKERRDLLKSLISEYCRDEINAGKCNEDDCEFCSFQQAYEKVAHIDDVESPSNS